MFSSSTSRRRQRRIKKSVNAIVLATSAAASVGLPSIFNRIASLRTTTSSAAPASDDPNLGASRATAVATMRANAAYGVRAQSVHVVPSSSSQASLAAASPAKVDIAAAMQARDPSLLPRTAAAVRFAGVTAADDAAGPPPTSPSSGPGRAQAEAGAAVTQRELDDEDWDAEFGVSAGQPQPVSPPRPRLPAAASRRQAAPARLQPRRAPGGGPKGGGEGRAPILLPFENRRIQSAPSITQRRFVDAGGSGVTDALVEHDPAGEDGFFDEFEEKDFVVASVKSKAERQRQREADRNVSAARRGGLESWDDDFAADEGEGESKTFLPPSIKLQVPSTVLQLQLSLKTDATNFRLFALHIEDLRLLHADARLMARGLALEQPERVLELDAAYAADLERAEVLVRLSEEDENGACGTCDERSSRVLAELSAEVAAARGDGLGGAGGQPSPTSSDETLCGGGNGGSDCAPGGLVAPAAGPAGGSRRLHVGVESMPALVRCVGVTKARLGSYVEELRAIALS
ncbi:hypothetical protein HK405_001902 [Cladochytrium tenue]|nr:hypothetical protein HK405_001902 [Cladochytrium tenue]